MQKPSKRRERGTAQLLRVAARNSNHEGKEGEEREGRGEVDYEGIRDMFCTPVRSTAVVCDGVVVHPAGSGAAATTEWRRLMHEGKGDAAVAGEGGLGLGKGDEARVGMLLRRMRLGCSRVGKARGRCVGG